VAGAALDRLGQRAPSAATLWALGQLSRARALLARGAEAELLYREAIEYWERTRVLTDLAHPPAVRRVAAPTAPMLASAHAIAEGPSTTSPPWERPDSSIGPCANSRYVVTHDQTAKPPTRSLTTQESRVAIRASTGQTKRGNRDGALHQRHNRSVPPEEGLAEAQRHPATSARRRAPRHQPLRRDGIGLSARPERRFRRAIDPQPGHDAARGISDHVHRLRMRPSDGRLRRSAEDLRLRP
jgi:hypothetical protein